MPSGEITLQGATAYMVGDPQRGFVQMADMINMSRLSNGMRAAGMMRRALTEALYISNHRSAFGKTLIELPLMRRQLLMQTTPGCPAGLAISQLAIKLQETVLPKT